MNATDFSINLDPSSRLIDEQGNPNRGGPVLLTPMKKTLLAVCFFVSGACSFLYKTHPFVTGMLSSAQFSGSLSVVRECHWNCRKVAKAAAMILTGSLVSGLGLWLAYSHWSDENQTKYWTGNAIYLSGDLIASLCVWKFV